MGEFIDLSPSPLSLIESLRSIGYSMQTAVADIIDNSLSAGADTIRIDFSWNDGNPWLAVIDNGEGLGKEELVSAMRFGSKNPMAARNETDLGRFGLGMKTASFSQCRRLTVMSKKHGQLSCCEWDIDRISRQEHATWSLGVLEIEDTVLRDVLRHLSRDSLEYMESGTIVLWENIDRVLEQGGITKQDGYFNAQIDDTRKHLELVFHRFLSPDPGRAKVSISMNHDELRAFNPFNPRNLATQELEEQQIVLDGARIVVQPYVLPHHNKVSRQEYEAYAGEGGYLHNQGFYVYRSRRLIIKGTWFRLIKKDELNKLIRVKVDIPNSLDHLWQIDVKKSHASPPEIIRNELKQVINKIEASGRRVYRQRGQTLSSGSNSPVWNRVASAGTVSYQINRDHPLVVELTAEMSGAKKSFVENIISMIESSFPVDTFFHDIANHPESVQQPRLREKELAMLLDVFIESWGLSGSLSSKDIERLLATDPFASNRTLAMEILNQRSVPNG